jgi:hypothetical protein
MTTRIREQLDRLSEIKNKCTLTITTLPVELLSDNPASDNHGETLLGQSLEQQIQHVANRVTQMILTSRERKPLSAGKRARVSKGRSTNQTT